MPEPEETPPTHPATQGPFGLTVPEDAKFDWNYYVRPGATPTDDQLKLAEAIFGLSDKLAPFAAEPAAERMREGLQDLFSATLVQPFTGDLERYHTQVAARERTFFRTIVTPANRKLLVKPVLYSAGSFVAILAAVTFGVPALSAVAAELRPYAFVCAGVLLGRLVYYGAAWGEVVATLDDYELAASMSASALLAVLFDLVVAIAACAAFASGFIELTIGAGENGAGGISTSSVATSGSVAFVFGMIVGIAKTDFVARLRKTAGQTAGGA